MNERNWECSLAQNIRNSILHVKFEMKTSEKAFVATDSKVW